MTGAIMDLSHNKWPAQRKLGLDKCSRDAMADYWRHRWPSNTAKHGAREFNLTLDQARSVVACRASQATIDQIIKAGGWPVIFAVGAMVIGQGADQYLIELGRRHEQDGTRITALVRDNWPWSSPGPDDPGLVDLPEAGRGFPLDRRVGEG